MKSETYSGEQAERRATTMMRLINKSRRDAGNKNLCVLVVGPGDDEWTIMDLKEAIKEHFAYTWEI